MTTPDDQRITPRRILLGRGLDSLPPARRLLVDAVGVLLTLAALVGVAFVFDFDRSYATVYLSVFAAVQVTVGLVRYLRARTQYAPLPVPDALVLPPHVQAARADRKTNSATKK